jgi:cytochrome c oxidase subunit 1
VAHFHQVLFGTAVFAGFAGVYYWYPKYTGRMTRRWLGALNFWTMFFGFWLTFIPQYLLGLHGMPRRISIYQTFDGFTTLNRISSGGAYLLGFSGLVFLINMYVSWRKPIPAGGNPWDAGTLEWACPSPPPHHNFEKLPPIRSERPVWDANHGEPELQLQGASGSAEH